MIYFLVDEVEGQQQVKIGFSKSPEGVVNRLRAHRGSNTRWRFYCAIDGDAIHEKKIHAHFPASRVATDGEGGSTETFWLTPDLQDYLEWLGEQPWAACSVDEVLDPWAHFAVETMWPDQPYRASSPTLTPQSLFVPYFGALRGPLPATERGSQYERNSNEWYTPEQYVEAARRVMGSIDLDPATSLYANRRVRAERIYTINHDGLAESNLWRGNVWCNPPYGRQQIPFLERLIREHEAGNVPQAVLCVNGYTYDTRWFRPLWRYALCFSATRIDFDGGATTRGNADKTGSPTNGTVFAYLGPHRERFADEFKKFGNVVTQAVPYAAA